MLTTEMKRLIENHSAGMVASINDDGTPSVSPKATFAIVDDRTLAFGNIRSPGTVANIHARPAVEVCFIDVVTRKAVRVTGQARFVPKADADARLTEMMTAPWDAYVPRMSGFVVIDVTAAEMILSPAYDIGLTEAELRNTNLAKLNRL